MILIIYILQVLAIVMAAHALMVGIVSDLIIWLFLSAMVRVLYKLIKREQDEL